MILKNQVIELSSNDCPFVINEDNSIIQNCAFILTDSSTAPSCFLSISAKNVVMTGCNFLTINHYGRVPLKLRILHQIKKLYILKGAPRWIKVLKLHI